MIFFKRKTTYSLTAFLAMTLLLLTSCDDHFFENEGDCEVSHAIRFVYDMNLKWADAFPSEVKSVNLYVFDKNGVFIKEYKGRGEELNDPSYRIILDLPANRSYQFLAWCGLDNGSEQESFSVPIPVQGVTKIEEMNCLLNTTTIPPTRSGEPVYSYNRLNFLYHGYIEEFLPDNHDGKQHEYTIHLTKDTNHIRLMLQQVNGNISADQFEFSLSAANGEMGWDNRLIANTVVNYSPWSTQTDLLGYADVNGENMQYQGVIADLSTCRLMEEDVDNIYITVKNSETGKVHFKVPLVQYSLLQKEYYEMAYEHKMTDQEFLDRQDEYVLTFFLDENMNWIYAIIEVLEWRIVKWNYEITPGKEYTGKSFLQYS